MTREQILNNLTEARKSRNLTQKQTAEALGISDKTYSKWETGETEPNLEQLCRLAEFYGLPAASFFSDDNRITAESAAGKRALYSCGNTRLLRAILALARIMMRDYVRQTEHTVKEGV